MHPEPLTLAALEAAIRSAWDVQTSDTPERYDPGNPERDQCGATALVVHDYLGGRLLESEARCERTEDRVESFDGRVRRLPFSTAMPSARVTTFLGNRAST